MAISSAPSATSTEPATPAITLPTIQRARPGSPRVAAAMMPMMSAASRHSRKTMTAELSMVGQSPYSAITTPCAVLALNSPMNGYLPGFSGPMKKVAVPPAVTTFSRFSESL